MCFRTYVGQHGVYIKAIDITIHCVEYEHDDGVGVFRFFNDVTEVATIDDKAISEDDIIILG